MKLALAVTLGGMQGLGTTEDHRERPVDRLTALGRAIGPVERRSTSACERGDHAAMESFLCSLGGDLIAFKFGNRAPSKEEAELKLAIALGWKRWGLKLRIGQYERIARCAVMEWAFDLCLTCRGAKEIRNYDDIEGRQPMKPCTECAQTGLRRYSDQERAEAMGEAHAKAMGWAHTLISSSESLAVRMVKARLERL
jgi:hypothetical protein